MAPLAAFVEIVGQAGIVIAQQAAMGSCWPGRVGLKCEDDVDSHPLDSFHSSDEADAECAMRLYHALLIEHASQLGALGMLHLCPEMKDLIIPLCCVVQRCECLLELVTEDLRPFLAANIVQWASGTATTEDNTDLLDWASSRCTVSLIKATLPDFKGDVEVHTRVSVAHKPPRRYLKTDSDEITHLLPKATDSVFDITEGRMDHPEWVAMSEDLLSTAAGMHINMWIAMHKKRALTVQLSMATMLFRTAAIMQPAAILIATHVKTRQKKLEADVRSFLPKPKTPATPATLLKPLKFPSLFYNPNYVEKMVKAMNAQWKQV